MICFSALASVLTPTPNFGGSRPHRRRICRVLHLTNTSLQTAGKLFDVFFFFYNPIQNEPHHSGLELQPGILPTTTQAVSAFPN